MKRFLIMLTALSACSNHSPVDVTFITKKSESPITYKWLDRHVVPANGVQFGDMEGNDGSGYVTWPVVITGNDAPWPYLELHCIFYNKNNRLVAQAWTNWSQQDIAVPDSGELFFKSTDIIHHAVCWMAN